MPLISASEAARRGFTSRPTIYRRIKDGRLSIHQQGDKRLLDVAELVRVFGDPSDRSKPPVPEIPIEDAIRIGRLEADAERLQVEVNRLRQERDQARQEASEEREQGRQERDRLMGILETAQRQIEDQTKPRSLWQRISGKD